MYTYLEVGIHSNPYQYFEIAGIVGLVKYASFYKKKKISFAH